MKQKSPKGRSIRRLVMWRPFVMVWRFPFWLLVTPLGLAIAVAGSVRLDIDWGEMGYDTRKWFAVLATPAFWLGYSGMDEYREARSHNAELSERRDNNKI